jgi:hypothetical protein
MSGKMKKILLAGAMVLMMLALMVPGSSSEQKAKFPFTVEKNIGTATFALKTYDEVWDAVVKTLVNWFYILGVVEKDTGIIEVEFQPDPFFWGGGSNGPEGTIMGVMIKKRDGGISVMLIWVLGPDILIRSRSSQIKYLYGEFYQAVADILYGKADRTVVTQETSATLWD